MVSEMIMDAFPDFLDKFYVLVPLVHKLFQLARSLIEAKRDELLDQIATLLQLVDSSEREGLHKKLKPVF